MNRVLIALLALVLTAVAARAQEAVDTSPVCSRHPAVARAILQDALANDTGLRAAHRTALEARAKKEGIAVEKLGDQVGGGDCAPVATPEGAAASAVGALVYNGKLHCSGVLVSPTMVVTAAHCVKDFDRSKMEFVLGPDFSEPIQRSAVYSMNTHDAYDPGKFGINDIAYVFLVDRMTEAAPVTLTTGKLPPTTVSNLLNVGFGIAGPSPGARRCVAMPLKDACDNLFTHATKGMNSCNGDSGGGVFQSLGNSVSWVGVTSWGDAECVKFSVNTDVGAYRDWISGRKAEALQKAKPAKVAQRVRVKIKDSAEVVYSRVHHEIGSEEKAFEDFYQGKWVEWTAVANKILPLDQDAYPDSCNVAASSGKVTLMLRQYPDSCGLPEKAPIKFTARLARLRSGSIELTLIEPIAVRPTTEEAEPLGQVTIVRVDNPAGPTQERRTRDIRLESQRATWSGRKSVCEPITVEAPWQLDPNAPIVFRPAHIDSAGFGEAQNKTPQGFCLPLWAEGFGGAQILGVTVDVGGIGVVSGTVEYGVKKAAPPVSTEVLRSVIRANKETTFALPDDGVYEMTVKMRDGRVFHANQSDQFGDLKVDWNAKNIVINPVKPF